MLGEDKSYITNTDLEGIKIALVVSKSDPKTQERLLVRVIGVHNMANTDPDNAIWANHCAPFASTSGDLPEPNSWVYVMFVNKNDFMNLIWLGVVRSSFQIDKPVITPTVETVVNNDTNTSIINQGDITT